MFEGKIFVLLQTICSMKLVLLSLSLFIARLHSLPYINQYIAPCSNTKRFNQWAIYIQAEQNNRRECNNDSICIRGVMIIGSKFGIRVLAQYRCRFIIQEITQLLLQCIPSIQQIYCAECYRYVKLVLDAVHATYSYSSNYAKQLYFTCACMHAQLIVSIPCSKLIQLFMILHIKLLAESVHVSMKPSTSNLPNQLFF